MQILQHDCSRKEPGRVAVLLYGLLREFQSCAPSLLRHVVGPNDAALFYFGPRQTDQPQGNHKGVFDLWGNMTESPKAAFDPLVDVEGALVEKAYGARLARAEFHEVGQEVFLAQSKKTVPEADWLFKLNPARIYSMFYNMEGAVKLLLRHEAETGERFQTVIITRPDIAFYSPVVCFPKKGELSIADGEGFTDFGLNHRGNAPVFYYKNTSTGDYVPGAGHVRFNDQVLIVHRDSLEAFLGLYRNLEEYLSSRAPASPETLLYLHLIGRGGLAYITHPEWAYEIFRRGTPLVTSLLDTPEICLVDRRHAASQARIKKAPLANFLRNCRELYRYVVR